PTILASTRKRPVIAARPWETFLKLSRTLHWSALRSTWTALWGPADDLPYHGWDVCVPQTSVKQLTHQVRETVRTRRPASPAAARARKRPRCRAAEQRDELAPPHAGQRASSPPWLRQSVYRTLSAASRGLGPWGRPEHDELCPRNAHPSAGGLRLPPAM